MKWKWKVKPPFYLRNLPEWNLFESKEQFEKACLKLGRRWKLRKLNTSLWLLMMVGYVVFTLVGGLWIERIVKSYLDLPIKIGQTVAILVFLGFQSLVLWYVYRKKGANSLRAQLLGFGIPVCIKCGYSLKGLTAEIGRCPECGARFEAWVVEIMNGGFKMDGDKG